MTGKSNHGDILILYNSSFLVGVFKLFWNNLAMQFYVNALLNIVIYIGIKIQLR